MIYAMVLLAASISTDPASPPKPSPTTAAAPDKISYQGIGNGWTGGRTKWWIERSGRGHYETTERGQRISKHLNVGVEGFERIRNILQPLENLETMRCDTIATDQAQGGLIWEHGRQSRSLRLDFGCARNNMTDAWARFGEANMLLVEWSTRAS